MHNYSTRYSKHGYGVDVRATYAHLPFPPFWTWLTGKDIRRLEPRHPRETLLKEWQLWCQLAFSWSLIVAAVIAGIFVYRSESMGFMAKAGIIAVVWVIIVGRTRGVLHTFHYTNHGASIADMSRARWIGKYFMSIPILHTPWENYHKIHARVHHAIAVLCTDLDPDQIFMIENRFWMGMGEREYWLKLVLSPFHPRAIWAHVRFRLEQNFIKTTINEAIPRAAFWIVFISAVTYAGYLEEIAVVYFVPLFILTQFSSWLQHTTEHLWFATKAKDISPSLFVASLTWGRFLGRPHPGSGRGVRHMGRIAWWWFGALLIDLPIRVFAFMQDLPSHDFHHRSPRVNFWSIARERAAHEGRPAKYGAMAETWGLMESWLILRDHLCYAESDPFGLMSEARERHSIRAISVDDQLAINS